MIRRLGAALISALMLSAGWWTVRLTGGTYNATTHVMYIPIVTAALAYGPLGGVLAGLAAGGLMAVTPLMVTDGTHQTLLNIGLRSVFYCGVGALVGGAAAGLRRRQRETQGLLIQSVTALTKAMEETHEHTAGHSLRVSDLSWAIGVRLGLDGHSLFLLRMGSLLHDIGKLAVPLSILDKPGRLTSDEYDVVRDHPLAGARILQAFDPNRMATVRDIVLHHHERLDGSGYPDGLRGAQITRDARIVAVADVYDALTSTRPYHLPLPHAEAVRVLREEAASGRLDGQLVELLDLVVRAGQFGPPYPLAAESQAG